MELCTFNLSSRLLKLKTMELNVNSLKWVPWSDHRTVSDCSNMQPRVHFFSLPSYYPSPTLPSSVDDVQSFDAKLFHLNIFFDFKIIFWHLMQQQRNLQNLRAGQCELNLPFPAEVECRKCGFFLPSAVTQAPPPTVL